MASLKSSVTGSVGQVETPCKHTCVPTPLNKAASLSIISITLTVIILLKDSAIHVCNVCSNGCTQSMQSKPITELCSVYLTDSHVAWIISAVLRQYPNWRRLRWGHCGVGCWHVNTVVDAYSGCVNLHRPLLHEVWPNQSFPVCVMRACSLELNFTYVCVHARLLPLAISHMEPFSQKPSKFQNSELCNN